MSLAAHKSFKETFAGKGKNMCIIFFDEM